MGEIRLCEVLDGELIKNLPVKCIRSLNCIRFQNDKLSGFKFYQEGPGITSIEYVEYELVLKPMNDKYDEEESNYRSNKKFYGHIIPVISKITQISFNFGHKEGGKMINAVS